MMGLMVAANKRFAEFDDSVTCGASAYKSYTCLDTGTGEWLRHIHCLFNNLQLRLPATRMLAIALQIGDLFAVFAHLTTELLTVGADAGAAGVSTFSGF
jgi:hypothetical protein